MKCHRNRPLLFQEDVRCKDDKDVIVSEKMCDYSPWLSMSAVSVPRTCLFIVLLSLLACMASCQTPQTPQDKSESVQVDGASRIIHLAVLLPDNNSFPFSLNRTLPAISLAIEYVTNQSLVPATQFVVRHADTKCSSAVAPIMAFEFAMKSRTHAILGPVCDYSLAPVARYSPYWKVPVISAGGVAYDFVSKEEFGLLTRVGMISCITMSNALSSFLAYHKWKRAVVIYDSFAYDDISPRFCYLGVHAFFKAFKERGGLTLDYVNLKSSPNGSLYEYILRTKVGTGNASKFTILEIHTLTRAPMAPNCN